MFVFVAIATFVLFFIPGASVQALDTNQQDPDLDYDCNAVDLILIIDQSGSMSGTGSGEQNDPDNFRIEAAQTMIYRLYMNTKFDCPRAVHRVAIISFGRQAEVDVSLTEIGYGTQREDIDALIKQVQAKSIGDTHPKLAISKAVDILESADPLGDLLRKRAVVLLTDGNPCVAQQGCVLGDYTFPLQRYMDELKQQINEGLPWYGPENPRSVYFWVIALNAQRDYLGTTGQDWKDVATGHGGELISLELNRQKIPGQLSDINRQIMGRTGEEILCDEWFYVDPYYRTALFSFHRADATIVMKIIKAGENEDLEVSGGVVLQGNRIVEQYDPTAETGTGGGLIAEYDVIERSEFYVLKRPLPGRWMVTSEPPDRCIEVEKIFEPLTVRANVLSPTMDDRIPEFPDSPYHDTGYPHIRLRLEDEGELVEQDPDFPITVRAAITDVTGTIHELDFEYSDGIFESVEPVPAPVPGLYNVHLVGHTRHADPELKDPFRVFEVDASYTVLDVERFGFQVIEPTEGTGLSLNTVSQNRLTGKPVEVQVQMLDEDGRALDPSGVIQGNVDEALEAVLYDPDGEELERLFLSQDLQAPDTFVGEFRQGQASLDPEGQYRMVVNFVGAYDTDGYEPAVDQAALSFRRIKVEGLQIRPETPRERACLPLHTGFCQSTVHPVDFRIRLLDLSGQPVSPQTVSDEKLSSLVTATLESPGHKEEGAPLTEPLTLTLEQDDEGPVLIARGASAMDQAGDYTVAVMFNTSALLPNYQMVEPHVQWHFTRKDGLVNSPLVCTVAKGAGVALVLAVLIFLIWLRIGSLHGVLYVDDVPIPVGGVINKRWTRKGRRWLQGKGLDKLQRVRVSPVSEEEGEVHVRIEDEEGGALIDWPMMSGVQELAGEYTVRYQP